MWDKDFKHLEVGHWAVFREPCAPPPEGSGLKQKDHMMMLVALWHEGLGSTYFLSESQDDSFSEWLTFFFDVCFSFSKTIFGRNLYFWLNICVKRVDLMKSFQSDFFLGKFGFDTAENGRL